MGTDCLYLKIYDYLKSKIISGDLVDGDRMPTEKELMKMYNVSRITAIKAMQKLENEHLIKRIRGNGSFVTYSDVSTYSIAKKPLDIHSKNIAFVCNCMLDIMTSVLPDFQKVAIANGYNVSVFDISPKGMDSSYVLNSVNTEDFCAIVCQTDGMYENISEFLDIIANEIPLVFLDNNISLFKVPFVKSNNRLGGYKVTKELIDCGHENIAVLFSDFSNQNEQERFGGYLQALSEKKIGFRKDNLMLYDFNRMYSKAEYVESHIYNLPDATPIKENFEKILSREKPPTAFFCMYDELASLVSQYIVEKGYKIPDDFSVVGYNNSSICETMITPLTSVDQNYHEIAVETMNLILAMINGKTYKSENYIEPVVCMRDSVKDIK